MADPFAVSVEKRAFARKQTTKPAGEGYGVGTVRQIVHAASIGGIEVTDIVSFSKSEQSYSAGSSLDLVLRLAPTDILVMTPLLLDDTLDWFAIAQAHSPLPVQLFTTVVVDNSPLYQAAEEFAGIVDSVDLDLPAGTWTIKCSSYARILVNAKISETTAGTASIPKTTGAAVQYFVNKYGNGLKLDPGALALKTPIGSVFKKDQVKTFRNVPVWDVLESFAHKDGADLFVKGDTLYYVKKRASDADDKQVLDLGTTKDYTFTYGKNILGVRASHAALFAHDITVTVRSFKPGTQETYEGVSNASTQNLNATADALLLDRDAFAAANTIATDRMKPRRPKQQRAAVAKTAQIGKKEQYVFVVPNLDNSDCDRLANILMNEITRREFSVELDVLGQPDFNPRQRINLQKLPVNKLNQVFAIKVIKTSSGPDGYKTTFTLVNHPVQSVAATFGS